MIKDKLSNAETYYGISKNLKIGFEWLKSQDLENIKPQKYIIESNNLYANVQTYATKEDAKYEAHKKYIDIQYMIKGKEIVGISDRNNCTVSVPYDSATDIEFLDCNIEDEWYTLNEGEFLVLFPWDMHKPAISPNKNSGDEPNYVKKVVVKVAYN